MEMVFYEFTFSDEKNILKSAYTLPEAESQARAQWKQWQEEKIARLEKDLEQARNQKCEIVNVVKY